ncbi:MAG: adenylyltransferase/cytidyltransferase family protein [Candidatus Hodarchaeales archaeon]|jgi:cytidyltransferase-like protein
MRSQSNSVPNFQVLLKEFLKPAYLLTLKFGSFSVSEFAQSLKRTNDEGKALLSVLKSLHMVKSVAEPPEHFMITTGGKNNCNVVLTGGVFDIIHLGHLKTLKKAKERGDLLFVVVASDSTVKKNKGRFPLNSQKNRIELLTQINVVDFALPGSADPSQFLNIVEKIKPNIIVLGYDQSLNENKLHERLEKRGLHNIEIVKLQTSIPNEKSSLKFQNLDEHSFD